MRPLDRSSYLRISASPRSRDATMAVWSAPARAPISFASSTLLSAWCSFIRADWYSAQLSFCSLLATCSAWTMLSSLISQTPVNTDRITTVTATRLLSREFLLSVLVSISTSCSPGRDAGPPCARRYHRTTSCDVNELRADSCDPRGREERVSALLDLVTSGSSPRPSRGACRNRSCVEDVRPCR